MWRGRCGLRDGPALERHRCAGHRATRWGWVLRAPIGARALLQAGRGGQGGRRAGCGFSVFASSSFHTRLPPHVTPHAVRTRALIIRPAGSPGLCSGLQCSDSCWHLLVLFFLRSWPGAGGGEAGDERLGAAAGGLRRALLQAEVRRHPARTVPSALLFRVGLRTFLTRGVCRGTVPTFNGAWGTMHVMKALYQQLSSEVDGELDKLVEAGQKPNLYNKRVGWNERASMDWQVALLGNERSTAVEKKRQATALRKANAAASMIQASLAKPPTDTGQVPPPLLDCHLTGPSLLCPRESGVLGRTARA